MGFGSLNVLLVEDNPEMMKIIIQVLNHFGIKNVWTARDGEEGFSIFTKQNPDLVISDWQMTPIDGLEMCRWIRRNRMSPNRMVPIILISGYSALPRVAQARDIGVTEFMIKPFKAEELAKKIMHVIDKPRDFVEAPGFVGPDRRRRIADFSGSERRKKGRK